MGYETVRLSERPELREKAAMWFSEKWGIPIEEYRKSMDESLSSGKAVPQWYLAVDNTRIVGGMGVIDNDFHDRTDLSPNVCAVYTEEDRRSEGIAGALLHYVCEDMKERGIDTLYLVTDLSSFYERYGWEFFCMVHCEGEPGMSRMYIHRSTREKPARATD